MEFIDVFNPRKEVVYAQIRAAGGIENYKGQILWISNTGKFVYPIGGADRVITEMSTDEGLANVKYRNVRCNFMPSGMIITKKGASSVRFDENGNPIKEDRTNEDTGFSDTIVQLQGDTNATKVLEVTLESDEENRSLWILVLKIMIRSLPLLMPVWLNVFIRLSGRSLGIVSGLVRLVFWGYIGRCF